MDADRRPDAAGVLERAVGTVVLEADPAALSVSCSDADRAATGVAELSRAGIGIAEFSLGQPSLDEVFLALTGHAADEARTTDPRGAVVMSAAVPTMEGADTAAVRRAISTTERPPRPGPAVARP